MLFQLNVQYQDIFYRLQDLGLMDVFLPFILIFTIVFAVLEKVGLFVKKGENNVVSAEDKSFGKKINSVLALAIALSVVVPHVLGTYPPGMDVVNIINSSLPGVSLVMVVILSVFLVLAFFGNVPGNPEGTPGGVVSIIALAVVVAIFGNAADWWKFEGMFSFLADPATQALIIFIAVFWFIIRAIVKEDKPDDKNEFMEGLGKLMLKH